MGEDKYTSHIKLTTGIRLLFAYPFEILIDYIPYMKLVFGIGSLFNIELLEHSNYCLERA